MLKFGKIYFLKKKGKKPTVKSINEQIDMSRKIGIPRDEILNDFMDLSRATNVF